MPARVLILGGGFAGVVASRLLKRSLGDRAEVAVIERRPRFAFAPSFVWLISHQRRATELVRDRSGLARAGVAVQNSEVTGIDLPRRQVSTADGERGWDFLVVALGAETDPRRLPGLAEGGINLYSMDGPQRLAEHLEQADRGRLAVLVAGRTFKCPWGPYEAALVSEAVLRRRGVRGGWTIDVYTPEDRPMEACGRGASGSLAQLLARRGISVHTGLQAEEVDPGARRIHFSGGQEAGYDLLAAVPPHRAPGVLAGSGLTDADGWVRPVGASLRTAEARVYAAGDVIALGVNGNGSLPKLGVVAHHEAQVVAANVAAEVLGREAGAQCPSRLVGVLATGISEAALLRCTFGKPGGAASHLGAPTRLGHWGKGAFERRFLATWL